MLSLNAPADQNFFVGLQNGDTIMAWMSAPEQTTSKAPDSPLQVIPLFRGSSAADLDWMIDGFAGRDGYSDGGWYERTYCTSER